MADWAYGIVCNADTRYPRLKNNPKIYGGRSLSNLSQQNSENYWGSWGTREENSDTRYCYFAIDISNESGLKLLDTDNIRVFSGDGKLHTDGDSVTFAEQILATNILSLEDRNKLITIDFKDLNISDGVGGYETKNLLTITCDCNVKQTYWLDFRFCDNIDVTKELSLVKQHAYYIADNVDYLTSKSDTVTYQKEVVDLQDLVTNCSYTFESDNKLNLLLIFSKVQFTFKADKGYKFTNSKPFLRFVFSASHPDYSTTLDETKTVAKSDVLDMSTLGYDLGQIMYIQVRGTADYINTIVDFAPFTKVYELTNDELGNLSNVRFYDINYDSKTVEVKDLGNYINKLFKLFCGVDTTTDKTNIYLYNKDTGVKSYGVTNQLSKVDCGTIRIPILDTDFNISSDIAVNVYLPFYGLASLNYDTYKGRTIQLLYIVDVLTGDSTIQLNDVSNGDENPVELDDFNCKLGYDIPYLLANDDKVNADIETNSKCWIDRTPYITIDYIDYNTEKEVTE